MCIMSDDNLTAALCDYCQEELLHFDAKTSELFLVFCNNACVLNYLEQAKASEQHEPSLADAISK